MCLFLCFLFSAPSIEAVYENDLKQVLDFPALLGL